MSSINRFSKLQDPPKPDLAKRPYSDKELEVTEEMQPKLEKLMEFFDQYGIDYGKFDPESIPRLDFSKRKAYPNTEVYMHVPGQHDTQKWLQAISDIYRKEKSGENRVTAIRRVTSGWNVMETFDFLNWVKFYEAGDHMKYKFAQLWFEESGPKKWYQNPELPGYALPIDADKSPAPTPEVSGADIDFAKSRATDESERRDIIEKQRNKIIGRLDSAEKLLRSKDGHLFAGKEFESLLESIYQLKKKIQMVNKISSSTRLYEDMIIRQANVLIKQGFTKAAGVLYSVAQAPTPTPPPDPTGAGNPGVPSGGAGTPAQPDGNVTMPQSEKSAPPGIEKFLKGLEKVNFSPSDDSKVEDDLEVEDSLEVNEADDELLVTEAQAVEPMTTTPAPAPLNPAPVAPPAAEEPAAPEVAEEPIEVTEDEIAAPTAPPEGEKTDTGGGDFNAKMDSMMANVSISDIVAELEDLAKVFKVREIPRRLALVDMMLDSKGLASYFPSLSEAQNKALEYNNYISSRVEDILSKLRGALSTKDVDLKGGNVPESPEVAGIKNKLQSDEEKEKARKQMRKDQEAAELAGNAKETPEVEIEEDLGAPAAPPPVAAPPKAPPPPA